MLSGALGNCYSKLADMIPEDIKYRELCMLIIRTEAFIVTMTKIDLDKGEEILAQMQFYLTLFDNSEDETIQEAKKKMEMLIDRLNKVMTTTKEQKFTLHKGLRLCEDIPLRINTARGIDLSEACCSVWTTKSCLKNLSYDSPNFLPMTFEKKDTNSFILHYDTSYFESVTDKCGRLFQKKNFEELVFPRGESVMEELINYFTIAKNPYAERKLSQKCHRFLKNLRKQSSNHDEAYSVICEFLNMIEYNERENGSINRRKRKISVINETASSKNGEIQEEKEKRDDVTKNILIEIVEKFMECECNEIKIRVSKTSNNNGIEYEPFY